MGESIHYTAETSEVAFDVYGYHEWMKKIGAFPTGIELTTGTPDAWTNMKSPTVDRVLWHFLEWRTTAVAIMDVILTGDTRIAKELSSVAGDLWSQIEEMAYSTILASRGVDLYGRLFIRIDPQITPEADRDSNFVNVMTLDKIDLESGIDLDRDVVTDASQVALSGVAVTSIGIATAFFSLAPGHINYDYGEPEVIDRLLLNDQAHANELAGLILGKLDNPYPRINFTLAANNNFISCIPPQYLIVSVEQPDTPRGIELISTRVIPRRRTMHFDPVGGIIKYELECETESFQGLSVDGDIPGSADTSFPPLPPLPPLPPPIVIIPGPETTGEITKVLLHDQAKGFIYTENFDQANPSWVTVNSGLSVNQAAAATFAFVCPNGAFYVGNKMIVDSSNYLTADANGRAFIARAPYVGGTFEILYLESTIRPAGDPAGRTWGVWACGHNPLLSEQVAFIIGETSVSKKIYVGANGSYTPGATVYGANVLIGSLSYGFGNWLFTTSQHYEKISPNGSSVVSTGSPNLGVYDIYDLFNTHVRAGTTGTTLHADSTNGHLLVGTNNLASIVERTDADVHVTNGMAVDITGLLIMLRYGAGLRGKSSDGGVTWATMGSLPYSGEYIFAWAGGAGASSRWIAAFTIVRYSPDFGTTWINKEGNITSIAPVPDINMIRVIG